MNRIELEKKLKSAKVSNSLFSLDGGLPNEKLCIDHENDKWVVYYSERGGRSGLVRFHLEDDACQYIYDSIMDVVNGNVR